jgi:hypothetical protein
MKGQQHSIVSDSNSVNFSRSKPCAAPVLYTALKPSVSFANKGSNMEQGFIADSVTFYVRQPGGGFQQVDEYDWLESEGKAYYRRFGGCGAKLCAVSNGTFCHL